MKPSLLQTKDGSYTLYNEELDETYHAMQGAYSESMHVYINNGLNKITKNEIHIFEIGFGTGLNAFLTAHFGRDKKIFYTALEPYQLDISTLEIFYNNIPIQPTKNWTDNITKNKTSISINDNFHLNIIPLAIENFGFNELNDKYFNMPFTGFDMVYYDAFAPSKQAEIWDITNLEKVINVMKEESRFVTYCSNGNLKRCLKSHNFQLPYTPGLPPKYEITSAFRKISAT